MLFDGNDFDLPLKSNKLDVYAKAIRICPANDDSLDPPDPPAALRVELYVCPPCGYGEYQVIYLVLLTRQHVF